MKKILLFTLVCASAMFVLCGCGRSTPEENLVSAIRAAETGDWKNARKFADRAAAGAPDHVGALVMRAIACEKSGDFDQAMDSARRAANLDPGNFAAVYTLGRLYSLDPLRCADAVNTLVSALKLKPESTDARILICNVLGRMSSPAALRYLLQLQKDERFANDPGLHSQLGVISGPSHAEEVSRDKLSYLTVACKEHENAVLIGQMFSSSNLKISYSEDIYGIEYAGILKNIYALAAGLAYGLGYGDNFRAVLTAASAKELTRFINESYPFERDTTESAYLGDLLVTSYSTFSRNRRLGQLIGHGCTVKSALNERTRVAEGYYASACIKKINERHNIHMPIADMVYDVLYCKASPRKKMKALSDEI